MPSESKIALDKLYPSPDSPEFKKDLSKAESMAESLNTKYKDKLESLSGNDFGLSIVEYEKTKGLLDRMTNYLFTLYSSDPNNNAIKRHYIDYSKVALKLTEKIAFFEIEIKRLASEDLKQKMEAKTVEPYRKWLTEIYYPVKPPFVDENDLSFGVLPNSLKLAGLS